MTVVTTLDITGMSSEEYRAVLDYMGVEKKPAASIYLHLTYKTDFGYRIIEIWDSKDGFDEFLEQRLAPATKALGINRETKITVTPLRNFFAPRLGALSALVSVKQGGISWI